MNQEFYQDVLNTLTDGVYFVDLDRTVTYWNKGAERLSGYSSQEVMGRSCSDNVLRHVDEDGTELCLFGCPLQETMTDGKVRETEVYMHHKLGHRVPVMVRATPMTDDLGNIVGAVEVFADRTRDVSIIKELEGLRKEILTDPLTEIGNRRYADITMESLDETMRESAVSFGVLFADLDFFKRVNDTWGHDAGDRVLIMAARTLSGTLRSLDVACRWGGEEFVIFVPNTDAENLRNIAERLRMLVESSWLDHEDERIVVTASFGGAVARPGEAAASVVDRADKQVYLSKEAGRNCVHIDD